MRKNRQTPTIKRLLCVLLAGLVVLSPFDVRASSWSPTVLVNTESFQIMDDGDSTTDIELRFGGILNEILEFDRTNSRFHFTDDLLVDGDLSSSGTLSVETLIKTDGNISMNLDQTATDTILTFGSTGPGGNETLTWGNSGGRFELSDDVATTGTFNSSGAILTEGDLTINHDQGAADAVLTFGSDTTNETLTFENTADQFAFTDDLEVRGTLSGANLTIMAARPSTILGSLVVGSSSGSNKLHLTGTGAMLIVERSSFTGALNTGTKSTLFSVDQMALGQLEGGAYFGRIGLKENQWGLNYFGNTWTAKESSRDWRSVAVSSDGKIQTVVVDTPGFIYVSTDYGNTWAAKGSSLAWFGIAVSSDGKIQTAVVTGGQIYISDDYGDTWTAKESNRNWTKVSMSSDGRIQTAVGAPATQIYISTDYGNTWVPKESSRGWRGIAMSSDGKIQTATANADNLYVSYDYGNTWTARDGVRTWRNVAVSSDGKIQTAVDNAGFIYVSYDYGNTWTAKGNSTTWIGIAMSSNGQIQTAVEQTSGQIYVSTDYGNTWTAKESDRAWFSVAMSSNGQIQTAVVAGGQIYVSYADSSSRGNVAIGTGSSKGSALHVTGTISGSALRVSGNATVHGTLAASGAVRFDDNFTINDDQGAVDAVFTFGSDGTNETLTWENTADQFAFSDDIEARGNFSGATIHAEGSLSASGTLFLNGGTFTGATVFHGPFTSDCDDATNSKLLWDSSTGKFSCGTDQSGGGGGWTDGGNFLYPTNGEDVVVGGTAETSYEVKINTGSRISATFSGGVVVNESGNDNDVRMEGDTDTNLLFLDASSNRIGIGKSAPGTKLDVSGTVSGAVLQAADGAFTAPSIIFQGSSTTGIYRIASDDSIRFRNTAGDLAIIEASGINANAGAATTPGFTFVTDSNTGMYSIADDVLGFSTGNTERLRIASDGALAASGTLSLEGAASLQGNVTSRGSFSGATIHSEGSLSASGTLFLNGGTFTGATVFHGPFTSDCDDATNSKLLWDSATGKFSCGSDQTGAAGGLTQAQGDVRFVNVHGDTMTGSLQIRSGSGVKAVGLEVTGTMSGRALVIQGTASGSIPLLTATGTTNRVGILTGRTNPPETALDVVGTISGTMLRVSSGASIHGALTASGTVRFDGDILRINDDQTADTNAVLTFGSDDTNETLSFADIGDRFEFSDDIATTGSLNASGAILTEGNLTINDDADSNNAVLTFGSDTTNETLTWNNSNDTFQFSDDVNTTGALSASGAVSFETSLDVSGATSGAWIHSEGSLSASGTLFLNGGTFTGATVFHGPFTSDCDDATNSKLLWDSATGKFSCGTDQSGGGSVWTDGGDFLYVTNGEDVAIGGTTEANSETKFGSGGQTKFNGVNYLWPSSTNTAVGASASGKVLSVNGGGQLSWSVNAPRIVVSTANVSDNTAAAPTRIPALNIPVNASTNYIIQCLFTTAAATTATGVQFTVDGPSSPTQVSWNRRSCSSTTALINANINAFGSEDARTTSAGTTRCVDTINIHLRNGATAGDVLFGLDSEVSGSAVTAYAGSFCSYQSY